MEQRNCATRPLKQHMKQPGPLPLSVCGMDHHGRLTDNLVKVTCKKCIAMYAHPKRCALTGKRRLQHVINTLLEERRKHEENHHS